MEMRSITVIIHKLYENPKYFSKNLVELINEFGNLKVTFSHLNIAKQSFKINNALYTLFYLLSAFLKLKASSTCTECWNQEGMAYIATSCFIKVKPAGGGLVTKTVSQLAKMSVTLPCIGGKRAVT